MSGFVLAFPAIQRTGQLPLGHVARGIADQPQRTRQPVADQRVAERHQHQRQRVLVHFPVFVPALADIVDQRVDRIRDLKIAWLMVPQTSSDR